MVNTIVGFAVIFLLMALGVAPVISNVTGYAVGLFLGFTVSRRFVFRSDGRIFSEGARYLFFFIICFLVNLIVLKYSLDTLLLNKEVAQLAAAASYTLLMYLFSYFFVFSDRR